jgi:hypothetical protein
MTQDESTLDRLVADGGRVADACGRAPRRRGQRGVLRAMLVKSVPERPPGPQVNYHFTVPHGGAASGFAFRLGVRHIVGEVDLLLRWNSPRWRAD